VILTLALAELASRWLFPGWIPENGSRVFWRYDELLGWSHRPGARGVHRQPDFAVEVAISPQGLRDRVYPEARTPGLCRMLVLGDSFTWGFGVEREQIWHERIEARRPEWEIVNTGVAGYATDQELLYLEKRGLALRPHVVLLLFHPNDLLENTERATSGYAKPYFELGADGALALRQVPVPEAPLRDRLDRWLHFHTYLLYRVYHPLRALESAREARAERAAQAEAAAEREARRRARKAGLAVETPAAGGPAPPNKYDVDASLTLALLARIDAVARGEGARFLVATVPMSDPPRSRLHAGLARLGIPHAGLDAAFERQRDVRFPHDPHWTPRGNEIAATAVESFLAAEGILGDARCAKRATDL
jgi:hypothetical protein